MTACVNQGQAVQGGSGSRQAARSARRSARSAQIHIRGGRIRRRGRVAPSRLVRYHDEE